MTSPTERLVSAAIDQAMIDLERARQLFPLVLEHSSRWPNLHPEDGGLSFTPEAGDQAALLAFLRALRALQVATGGLGRRLPALAGTAAPVAARPAIEAKRCVDCGTARGPFRHGRCDRCRKRRDRAIRSSPSEHQGDTPHAA